MILSHIFLLIRVLCYKLFYSTDIYINCYNADFTKYLSFYCQTYNSETAEPNGTYTFSENVADKVFGYSKIYAKDNEGNLFTNSKITGGSVIITNSGGNLTLMFSNIITDDENGATITGTYTGLYLYLDRTSSAPPAPIRAKGNKAGRRVQKQNR